MVRAGEARYGHYVPDAPVVGHVSHGPFVELEGLVRAGGQVEVEPHHAAVVRPDEHVVAGGVDVQGRYPLAPAVV